MLVDDDGGGDSSKASPADSILDDGDAAALVHKSNTVNNADARILVYVVYLAFKLNYGSRLTSINSIVRLHTGDGFECTTSRKIWYLGVIEFSACYVSCLQLARTTQGRQTAIWIAKRL